MNLLNRLKPHEWKRAKLYFEDYPNEIKLKLENYSFLKINGRVYMMARHELLGMGSFNKVKIVQDENGRNYKVNIGFHNDANANENNVLKELGEFYGEAKLHHPSKQSTGNIKVYKIIKLREGQTLYEYLKNTSLSLNQKLVIALNIVNSLKIIHEKAIIHRDLKPKNIIINEKKEIYLIDFGMATFLPYGQELIQDVPMGTPGYIAPEIMNMSIASYSYFSDLYALGCIFRRDLKLPKHICDLFLAEYPNYRSSLSIMSHLLQYEMTEFNDVLSEIPLYSINFVPPWVIYDEITSLMAQHQENMRKNELAPYLAYPSPKNNTLNDNEKRLNQFSIRDGKQGGHYVLDRHVL